MKYSYNWLKELSGTKKTAQQIVDALTMHSFEVEGIEKFGSDFEGVVVGKILEIKKHPNADKLQLTKVLIKEEKALSGGGKVLDIVCGAQNISVGDKVPVALVGTKLPNGIEIKEAEIRGEKSVGMLCAMDELGLGEDHSGILLLPKNTKIGTAFAKTLGEKDEILEIKVLPDRGHDALSHVGMAREIAALEGKKMEYVYDELKIAKKKTKKIKIKIENKELCPRYLGAVMENVKIQDSPSWLKQRLEACGIRPINNVVDATNFVMLELGQPLHAFDFEKVMVKSAVGNQQSAQIIIRNAKEKEKISLLDGSKKELSKKDIVIADNKKPIALAGIMGGDDSGISEKTAAIILEAANFEAVSIRKTRTRLNMLSDAAMRFEKELDPNLAEKALVRVIEILEHIADAKLEGVLDVYPKKAKAWNVKLNLQFVNKLLGEKISVMECKKILSLLGIGFLVKGNMLIAKIPTFRIDLKTQEDLIEEIGRLYGYEKIKAVAPVVSIKAATQNEKRIFERALKSILVGQAFSEVYNYSFYGASDAENAKLDSIKHLELESPLNQDQTLLRVSLVPNLLKNIHENLKNYRSFNIFEIGRIFLPNTEILPQEKTMVVGAIVLENKGDLQEKKDKRQGSSFYEAKGYVDSILSQLAVTGHYYDEFKPTAFESPSGLWHHARSAEIKIIGSEKTVGFLGEINPAVLSSFDINTRVAIFEFDLEMLMNVSAGEREYRQIRKFPIVMRDLSMLANEKVRVDDILQIIQQVGKELVLDVELFDVIDFVDSSTSFAFHISLGAEGRTLTGKEIEDVINMLITELEKTLGVKVRK